MQTATVFGYLDNLYASEIALFRGEGVTQDEAEPFAVSWPLPCRVWRVSGEFFSDFDDAMAALQSDLTRAAIDPHFAVECRMVSFKLNPDGHSYSASVAMEHPAAKAWRETSEAA
jgi:hypothetical protein